MSWRIIHALVISSILSTLACVPEHAQECQTDEDCLACSQCIASVCVLQIGKINSCGICGDETLCTDKDAGSVTDAASLDDVAVFDVIMSDSNPSDHHGYQDVATTTDAFQQDDISHLDVAIQTDTPVISDVNQTDSNRADMRVLDSNRPDISLSDTRLADLRRPDLVISYDSTLHDNFVDDSARPDLTTVHDANQPFNNVELFAIGDSVTRGFCASDGNSYYELLIENDDDAYPEFAGKDLRSHFAEVNAMNPVYNWAVNGATSCYFESSKDQFVEMLNLAQFSDGIKLMVMTLGGNDLIHDYSCYNPVECAAYCSRLHNSDTDVREWAQNFKLRLEDMIEIAQANIPGPLHIFLANIYDPSDGVGDLENAGMGLPPWPDGLAILEIYNQKIQEICDEDESVHCVDMYSTMLGHGIHYNDASNPYYDSNDPSYWYCSSLLEDPNDRGYNAIRGVFWREIEAVLGL